MSDTPTVDALDALWREVSAKPLWAPGRFVTYLKLRRRVRLKMMQSEKLRVVAPPGKVNDCSACTDVCCVGPKSTVLLTLHDIATLRDLGRDNLMTLEKPVFTEQQQRERPALKRQLASHAWSVFPVLRQNSLGACEALHHDGKCTLFPHWPLTCERFPYALNVEAEEIFYSQRCDSFWIRQDRQHRVERMTVASVAAYNARIKDWVLLTYAPQRIAALGLTRFLNVGALETSD